MNEEAASSSASRRRPASSSSPAAARPLVTVKDVVSYEGAGTADSAVLMPLAEAQALWADPIRCATSSSPTAATSGRARAERRSRKTLELPRPRPGHRRVEAGRVEAADLQGNLHGLLHDVRLFSIAAGILLIFLVFVMLARSGGGELGIAAIGTRRGISSRPSPSRAPRTTSSLRSWARSSGPPLRS